MREVCTVKPKKRGFSLVPVGTAVFLMGFAVIEPQVTKEAVSVALSLLAGAVIPSLVIFAMASKLLVRSGVLRFLAKLPLGGVCRAFGISPLGLTALVTGLLAGFPMGAIALSDLVKQGDIGGEEAAGLLPYCNNAGAAFVIGTAGLALFGKAKVGYQLFGIQTAAVLTALFLTAEKRKPFLPMGAGGAKTAGALSPSRSSNPKGIFVSAVSGGVTAMLSVSGYVVFFSVLSAALRHMAGLLPVAMPSGLFAVFSGVLELTGGLFSLAGEGKSATTLVTAAVLLGFGGLSVFMQASDAAEGAGISTEKYLAGKGLVCLLCALYGEMIFGGNGRFSLVLAGATLCWVFFVRFLSKKSGFFAKKGGKTGECVVE